MYKKSNVLHAIKRSLRGEAGRIILRLGYEASLTEILDRLDNAYSGYGNKETLLAKFYSAKQDDEDIQTWSYKLEDILNRAVDKNIIDRTETPEMLRSMFWTGMKQELKDRYGYKFELIKDYEQLRREVVEMEQEREHNITEKISRTTAKCVVDTKEKDQLKDDVKELKGCMAALTSTVMNLDKKFESLTSGNVGQNRSLHQPSDYKGRQHLGEDSQHHTEARRQDRYYNEDSCRTDRNEYQYESRRQQGYNKGYDSYRDRQYRQQGHNERVQSPPRYRPEQRTYNRQDSRPHYNRQHGAEGYSREDWDPNVRLGPKCYRCRQRGHFQWQCRTRIDHRRHHLNY